MKHLVLGFFAVSLLLCVVGCGNGIAEDDYNKVKIGMSLQQVKDILGEPSKTEGVGVVVMGQKLGSAVYIWKRGGSEVRVTLTNEKVATKTHSSI